MFHPKKLERLVMKNNCPSCESRNIKLIGKIPYTDVFAGKALLVPLNGGELYSCDMCNCFFRFPRLPKREMDALYRLGDDENWTPLKDQKRPDWQIAYSWIHNNTTNRQVLDVGCFSGEYLKGLLNTGADFYGIEIHKKAAERAMQYGVEIIGEDFECLRAVEKRFDVVTSFDVIEHVYNPKLFLNMLADVTKPGGEIIISTGNSMAISWRLMGSRYWYCTIGEHISFINPQWCEQVAHELGLEVTNVEYFSHAPPSRLTLINRVKEIISNLVYRFLPIFFHSLRKSGFGSKDIVKHPVLLDYPPVWVTAKDHFIIRFRKKL